MNNGLKALEEKLSESSIATLVEVLRNLSTQTTGHAKESFKVALNIAESKLSPVRFERLKKSL